MHYIINNILSDVVVNYFWYKKKLHLYFGKKISDEI